MMRIEETFCGEALVYSIYGKIMGGDPCTLLRGKVRESIDAGRRLFVIDLGHVVWMNSSGLSMLMVVSKDIRRFGGQLKISNIDSIEKVLVITRLTTHFEIFDSTEEAVASMEPVTQNGF